MITTNGETLGIEDKVARTSGYSFLPFALLGLFSNMHAPSITRSGNAAAQSGKIWLIKFLSRIGPFDAFMVFDKNS